MYVGLLCVTMPETDMYNGIYSKAVLIQHFRFDTNTDIVILILINKIYPTVIIILTNTSFSNRY